MPLRVYNYFLLHNIEAAGDEPNFRLLTGKCKHHIFLYDCLYDSNEVLSDYQGLSGSYYSL